MTTTHSTESIKATKTKKEAIEIAETLLNQLQEANNRIAELETALTLATAPKTSKKKEKEDERAKFIKDNNWKSQEDWEILIKEALAQANIGEMTELYAHKERCLALTPPSLRAERKKGGCDTTHKNNEAQRKKRDDKIATYGADKARMMKEHKCKYCSKFFINGGASLTKHMETHITKKHKEKSEYMDCEDSNYDESKWTRS